MKSSNIEDIYIGNNGEMNKKSKKGVIIVIFIILVLLLVGMVGAYFYFSNQTLTKKQLFINSISNTNIKKFLENDVYNAIINRLEEENSETETKIQISTTDENAEPEGVDFSNFEFNLNNQNDIENSKSFGELTINYSGNELFKARYLSNEDAVAVASDEIVDRYIGIHYDKMQDVLGININKDTLDELKNAEQISLTEDERSNYITNYAGKFFENIGEEKFASQENLVIQKNNTSIDVVSYELVLSQDEYKNVLTNVLTNLRDDQDLLSKLVVENSSNIENRNNSVDENQIQNNQNEINTVVPSFESDQTINLQDQTDSGQTVTEVNEETRNSNIEVNMENQTNNNESIETNDGNSNENLITSVETTSDLTPVGESENTFTLSSENIISLILGKKIDISVSELQEQIDNLIEDVKNSSGNGIKITVYVNVSNNNTEKISATLPDGETLDMEFTTNESNENDNTLKLTYIKDTETTIVTNNETNTENGVETYSAEDDLENTAEAEAQTENSKDGFTLNLNKVSSDASTTLKIGFEFVEKEQINQKFNIEIKTNGTESSNNIKNDIVFTFGTDTNEYKLLLDNTINFNVTPEIEDLTDENCLFVENLSEEEFNSTMQAIQERIGVVYQEKMNNLNVIDTNTNSPIVESNTQTEVPEVTREEAKEALIQRVSNLMGEAQNNGEEFTIQNLANLTMDGFDVSADVTDTEAIIVVDTYKFRIDPNFVLTDVEE